MPFIPAPSHPQPVPSAYASMNDQNLVVMGMTNSGLTLVAPKGMEVTASSRRFFVDKAPTGTVRLFSMQHGLVVDVGAFRTKAWNIMTETPGRARRETSTERLAKALRTPVDPRRTSGGFESLLAEFLG